MATASEQNQHDAVAIRTFPEPAVDLVRLAPSGSSPALGTNIPCAPRLRRRRAWS